MLGAVLFLVMFILIAPATRNMLLGMLGDSGSWIVRWAPFSYILVAFVAVAGIFSLYLMTHWPKTPEPDNPLARYKHDDLGD